MRMDLSNVPWEVKGFYPWVPYKDKSMETGKELMGVTDWIPAVVPGGVHYDLYRAGMIEHPYRDLNSLACEWVEHRWWKYRTFLKPPFPEAPFYRLVFEGLDDEVAIYVNHRCMAEHKGMFEAVRVDVTQQIKEAQQTRKPVCLEILFRSVPDEMGQIGRTSLSFTQKARFGYKWDFGTRLVNIGIWQNCYLESAGDASLCYPQLHSTVDENGNGVLRFRTGIERRVNQPLMLRCRIEETKQEMNIACTEDRAEVIFHIPDPALWYPNGYGEQPLYSFRAVLSTLDGREVDSWCFLTGIRKLEYRLNKGAPEDSYPYTFVLNGKIIYVKGVNMTPLDHLYGNVSDEHYAAIVERMKCMHVNMVRIWGGGIIEKDVFYRLCDKAGILIWQEFIQSSSGIDNVPSKRPEFLELLSKTATHAVRSRSSHPSLAVWSGGNELTQENFKPASYEDTNIAMLKAIVEKWDAERLFLPTSASGPREFISEVKGVSHDIHGHWNYCGNPYHYQLYSQSDSLFHSEFGTDGMCCEEVLKQFVSEPHRLLNDVENNLVYRHHGEWWCTWKRDSTIFGEPSSMREMCWHSQWMQAEGLRFILEANRRRAMCNSGSIIWQINEPWPNVFCTSLLDYGLNPKLAWYWAGKAFESMHISLTYDRLDHPAGSMFEGKLFLSRDDGINGNIQWKLEAFTPDGNVFFHCENSTSLCSPHSAEVSAITFAIPETMDGMFVVRIWAACQDSKECSSEYWFGSSAEHVYAQTMGKAKIRQQLIKQEGDTQYFLLENESDVAALHVLPSYHPDYLLLANEAGFTLLPGEKRQVKLHFCKRFSSGFISGTTHHSPPDFTFECLNDCEVRE